MSKTRKSSDLVTILPTNEALAKLLEIDDGDPFNLKDTFYVPLLEAIKSGRQPADKVALAFVDTVDQYTHSLRKDSHDSELGPELETSLALEDIESLIPHIMAAIMSDRDDGGLVHHNIRNFQQARRIVAGMIARKKTT